MKDEAQETEEIQDRVILKEGIQDLKEEAQEPEEIQDRIILKEGIQDMKDEAQEPEEIPGDDEGNEGENEPKDDVRGQMLHQEVEELEREKRSRRKHNVMVGRMQRQKEWDAKRSNGEGEERQEGTTREEDKCF